MTDRTDWREIVPLSVRRFPADLAIVVVAVVAVAVAVFVPVVNDTPLRALLGYPFVLFVPGYAFIAALFPAKGRGISVSSRESPAETVAERAEIDGLERLALSVGTSLALTPLFGLVLNATPLGVTVTPVVAALGVFTLLATGVAAIRRNELPADERFAVPFGAWAADVRGGFAASEPIGDRVLNVALVTVLLLSVGSAGYVLAADKPGETSTAFYLVTKNGAGDFVADDYPTNFTRGQSRSIYVGIENHEHRTMNYTVVAELQRVRITNGSTAVEERQKLGTFDARLAANETWRHEQNVTPKLTGHRLRLTYLLYEGTPPSNPQISNADSETHLWINVSAPNGSANASLSE